MGGAYDLFGNGKTAIKVSMSKYLQAPYSGEAYTVANPAVSLVTNDHPGLDRRRQRLRRRLRLPESGGQRRVPGRGAT